jgi:hypothetical protein
MVWARPIFGGPSSMAGAELAESLVSTRRNTAAKPPVKFTTFDHTTSLTRDLAHSHPSDASVKWPPPLHG